VDVRSDLPADDDDAESLTGWWPGSERPGPADDESQPVEVVEDEGGEGAPAADETSLSDGPRARVGTATSAERMESLQDALLAIRSRVEALSSRPPGEAPPVPPPPAAPPVTAAQAPVQVPPDVPVRGAVDLQLYHQAQEQRTLAELRRHALETEESLRRITGVVQDLSIDLRSIVDAARRAIDQTSEQAESSVELGRLLGRRLEQLDDQVHSRLDDLDEQVHGRLDQLDKDLTRRLERIEIGPEARDEGLAQVREEIGQLRELLPVEVLREEIAELRDQMAVEKPAEGMGQLRDDIAGLRDEISAGSGSGAQKELRTRLELVSEQLTHTLESLAELIEGAPAEDEAAFEDMLSTIKAETEAAVDPFRTEVQELGRRLAGALDRDEELGQTLATLTDEVQRLRRRIAVRATPAPPLEDEQLQVIARAVIAALPGGSAPPAVATLGWEGPEEAWAPDAPEEQPEYDPVAEPEAASERPIRARRQRREERPLIRARKASGAKAKKKS
jgi:hypothetical protein